MSVPPPEEASRTERLLTPVRGAVALAIWTAMVAGIACAGDGRRVEAKVASHLTAPVTHGRTGAIRDVILTGLGTRYSMGFQITNECTVLLLIVPMLFLAGLILLFRRFSIHNVLFGLLMGVLIVAVTNQLRIILIAWATQEYGLGFGYELTHKFIGSFLAILGFSAGLLVMLKLSPGRGRRS